MGSAASTLIHVLAVVGIALCFLMAVNALNRSKTRAQSTIHPSTYKTFPFLENMLEDDWGGVTLERATVHRVILKDLNGYHLIPDIQRASGSILVLGGFGGTSNFPLAAELAQRGYEVFTFYYFGKEHQQPELYKVPLELFESMYNYLSAHQKEPGPLTVIGQSNGAEFAALIAATYPQLVDNIVLYAPTSHVFQGLNEKERGAFSSWTYQGKELPFITFERAPLFEMLRYIGRSLVGKPVYHEPLYTAAYRKSTAEELEAARIKLEHFSGNILMFAGGQDGVWPSKEMGQNLAETYKRARLFIYEDAGHVFIGPPVLQNIFLGGEYRANESAKLVSDKELYTTLNQWLCTNGAEILTYDVEKKTDTTLSVPRSGMDHRQMQG